MRGYVQPFLDRQQEPRVRGRGQRTRMVQDGKELFFVQGTKMMASRVSLTPGFSASRPEALFDAPWRGNWVVAPNGRFLMIRMSRPDLDAEIRVVLNWSRS